MPNDTIRLLQNHRSIRAFDASKEVSEEALQAILRAVQRAPNSCHAQQISVITVRSAERRQKIMELAQGRGGVQQYIADAPIFLLFTADYHKVSLVMEEAGQPFELIGSLEALLTAAVDTGIYLEAATVASESLGLGTVCIGALRWRDLAPLMEYMELPAHTFPVCGMCIGWPTAEGAATKLKPRLPYATFVHPEKYNPKAYESFAQTLKKFNEEMTAFAGVPLSWSDGIGKVYSNPQLGRHLGKNFSDQGFKF